MNEILRALTDVLSYGTRIACLGVGSPLRADDAVGLYLLDRLKERLSPVSGQELRFYRGESAPENFSGEIRQFAPTHLVILDAAQLEELPGSFRRIDPEAIAEVSFTTHMLPLKVLVAYLQQVTSCQTLIVGVQPQLLDFGTELSPVVQKAADEFVEELFRQQAIGM